MKHSPKREERQPKHSPAKEVRQMRFPSQAAPVRREERPPGPFRSETAHDAICQILAPNGASQCMAVRGHA
jgi:hypothetical protein